MSDDSLRRGLRLHAESRWSAGDEANNIGTVLVPSLITLNAGTGEVTIAAGARLVLSSHAGDPGEQPYGEVVELPLDVVVAGACPTVGTPNKFVMARVGAKGTGSNANRVFYDGTSPDKEKVLPIDTRYSRVLEWTWVDKDDAGAVATKVADGYLAVAWCIRVPIAGTLVGVPVSVYPYPNDAAKWPDGLFRSASQAIGAIAHILSLVTGANWDSTPSSSLNDLHASMVKQEAPDLCILWLDATTPETIATATATDLTWNVEVTDVEAMHAVGDDKLVAVTKGWYHASTQVRFTAPADGTVTVRIYNKTDPYTWAESVMDVKNGDEYTVNVEGYGHADIGDEIAVYFLHDCGVNLNVHEFSKFHCCLARVTSP